MIENILISTCAEKARCSHNQYILQNIKTYVEFDNGVHHVETLTAVVESTLDRHCRLKQTYISEHLEEISEICGQ